MQSLWVLLVVCCLGVGVVAEGEVPECEGWTPEKVAQLKGLVVTEDVHDKLAGDYTELWGPKQFLDEDENTCIKYTRTKTDDTHLDQILHAKGAWFGGELTKNSTITKVENGVYLMKRQGSSIDVKFYIIYSGEHVKASFGCFMHAAPADSKDAKLPSIVSVGVHSHDLKTPLDADVQAEVDAAVKKVQDHKDVLGEMVQFPHTC